MQTLNTDLNTDIVLITQSANITISEHGGRAKCLQRLLRMELPVPRTVALSFALIHKIAAGTFTNMGKILDHFDSKTLLCVRPSSENTEWGGPSAILNVGINDETFKEISITLGDKVAANMYLSFVRAYSIHVARLDPEVFDSIEGNDEIALANALRAFEDETKEKFPQQKSIQLQEVLRSMARAWESTTARLLREANGAPADAGLGLIVQKMALGNGKDECGSGLLKLVDSNTGKKNINGIYYRQDGLGIEAERSNKPIFLTLTGDGPSLEEEAPKIFENLRIYADLMRKNLKEEMQLEFAVQDAEIHVLDGTKLDRRAPAALRIAVSLAEDGIISKEEALMRVEPQLLGELLHRQVKVNARRDKIGDGIAASPGAASGRIVFSSEAALAFRGARGVGCVLVRRETSPEDIRGMHSANAVLTERGGMTSHAAVIGRGIGLPCVVGANNMHFQIHKKQLITSDGRTLNEGDIITVDGTNGEILFGETEMVEASLDESFQTLMRWAEQASDIAIRANADTPADAITARNFNAHGIGLCRTEHMFFESDRLTVMQEMIFAEDSNERKIVLDRLLPMQRADFTELFRIMQGLPVCIRLFDPPLHEFLPSDRAGLRDLAEALDLPLSRVIRRVEDMKEHNPMLGLRGVRLGVTIPEIYEMQARAIFEATIEASKEAIPVEPEIMIPLVSARREVELVKSRIDAVAFLVRSEQEINFNFSLGVMVETPRAALRSNEIAQKTGFLSFGTNDLTQMTYGLSRDDAGRFMNSYVQKGVFPEDPFHVLDRDGVGELLELGAIRAKKTNKNIILSVCGEHGASPDTISFCRKHGFNYVSCSPFRVPIARLAAAQLAISDRGHQEQPS